MKLFKSKTEAWMWFILVLILVFIFSAFGLVAQTVVTPMSVSICADSNPKEFTPAPCNITGVSDEKVKFLIQIGVYKNKIVPMPYTMSLKVGDLYYYYINRFYDSRESAQEELNFFNTLIDKSTGKPLYCDGLVVPCPIKDLSFYE